MPRPIEIGDIVKIAGPHQPDGLLGQVALVLDRVHYLQDYYDCDPDGGPSPTTEHTAHRDEYSCKIKLLGDPPQVMMMRAKWLKILSKIKEK